MIVDGRLKIDHLIQHQTQIDERFYWRAFFAEVIAQNGVPEDYYAELAKAQPEFDEKKTRDQMKAPSNQQYLAKPANPLEYYKLFRGIDPAVVEPEKLGQVTDDKGVVITPPLDDDAFYYQHFKAFIDLEYRDMEGHLELRYDPREIKGRQWFKYNPKGYYELTFNAIVQKIFFVWADQYLTKETTVGKTAHIMQRLESDCIFTDIWDADPNLDNCLDGLVNLTTHEIIPHSAGYMTRKQVPRHYDPTRVEMPDFLKKALDSLANKDIILKYFVAIVHKYRDDEMFLMCYGPRGAGKSTLLQIFENMLGIDLVSKTPWKKFGSRFGMKECYDKRVNVCPDLEIKYVSSEAIAMLKNLTGKDGLLKWKRRALTRSRTPSNVLSALGRINSRPLSPRPPKKSSPSCGGQSWPISPNPCPAIPSSRMIWSPPPIWMPCIRFWSTRKWNPFSSQIMLMLRRTGFGKIKKHG